MKHILTTLLLLAAFASVWAHPAGKVSASFNATTNVLSVSFDHKVSAASEHYIYVITVQVNGKDIIRQSASLQDSTEGGSYVYKLPGVKKDDKITVITECNKGGKKSTTIKI